MSTAPDNNDHAPANGPALSADEAKAAAKARAIERARELAAQRSAQQQAAQANTTAPSADDAKAAAKARAIERARELAAQRRAQKEAAQANTTDPSADDAKAAAKARAIERARELAAQRRAQKEAAPAEASTDQNAADAQAAAKARAIERARELAAQRHAQKEAAQAEPTNTTAESQATSAQSTDEAQAAAQARAIERARAAAAARKAQPAPESTASARSDVTSGAPGGAVEGVLVPAKPKQPSLFEIFLKGIWKDNPGLCQLLGMCPLLAVTTSAANALGLGIATILVLMLSSSVIALIRRLIVPEVRIPIYVIIIAALVTVVRFEVEANFPQLYQQLGIYLSLIATNCIIMGRAEAFAGHNNVLRSLVDAIASGIGFTLVLFALGSLREIIGNGTWLVGASDLLGSWAAGLEVQLYSSDYTLLIAILPPGGFFVLAFLIAAKNAMDGHAKRKAERRARINVLKI